MAVEALASPVAGTAWLHPVQGRPWGVADFAERIFTEFPMKSELLYPGRTDISFMVSILSDAGNDCQQKRKTVKYVTTGDTEALDMLMAVGGRP
ncbi:hypothetical protein llap_9456 [Limosa lapponica baueri]|uniref:Uncharacterized protein n=1 Tax=Limosa lapponica baueri TaxID=1758121 RepID=A0A2I0U2I4_LIMLA|nr:hypothetical protein llap_9456 [Limosa lapponica baueri]